MSAVPLSPDDAQAARDAAFQPELDRIITDINRCLIDPMKFYSGRFYVTVGGSNATARKAAELFRDKGWDVTFKKGNDQFGGNWVTLRQRLPEEKT